MDDLDPGLAGYIAFHEDLVHLVDIGLGRSSHAGSDEVEILWEVKETEVSDFRKLTNDGDTSKLKKYDQDTKQETMHHIVLEEASLACADRLNLCKCINELFF